MMEASVVQAGAIVALVVAGPVLVVLLVRLFGARIGVEADWTSDGGDGGGD
jgi:hypothetical protein